MTNLKILYTKKESNFWNRYKPKIASTLFAIIIWFLIVTGGVFEHVTTIPIAIPENDQNFVITNTIPRNAKVRIRGQGVNLLAFLIFREGKLWLNDITWKSGKTAINPSQEDIVLTGTAKTLNVIDLLSPKKISLEMKKVVEKTVPVKPEFIIKPKAGYTLVGDISIQPPRVTIRGPDAFLDSCTFVRTEKAKWENLKYPLRKRIDLIDPDIRKSQLLQHRVEVYADVQKLMEKELKDIPVRAINLPAHSEAIIFPSTLSLVIEGGVQVVSNIGRDDIRAVIDYAKQKRQNKKHFTPEIEPIPKVRFRDIDPRQFKIILERNESKTR